jgi:predicted dehydrogenase
MVNLDLAGGALLDLGIYALTWVFQTLYHTQLQSQTSPPQPPTVVSALRKYSTGADDLTSMLLTFPRADGSAAHGIATTGMAVTPDPDGTGAAGPAIRVQGHLGEIQVFHPAFRPTRTKLILRDGTPVEEKVFVQPGPGKGSGWSNGYGDRSAWPPEGEGSGMFWEADECANALREGRKEGRFEGLEESLVIMRTMDEVRRQHGLVYPERIETVEYPVDLSR